MKPQFHVASSVLIAGIIYMLLKSWSMALSCLLSGIFIDVDHVYDYIKRYGFPMQARDIHNALFKNDITRWTMVLHSWELVLALYICAWITNWNEWITGILIGFGHHIIIDALFNGVTILNYSFVWRWKNNFIVKKRPSIT